MSHRYRIRGAVAALVLTLVVSGASQLAAQSGAVTGVVTDATGGQPLEGARIGIAGTRIGGLADSEGRYLIRGVPPGVYTVKVVMLGYGTRQREVAVTAGSTEVADFRLRVSAVYLDQPVTEGAGWSERRKIGTSLPSMDFDGISETFPVDGFGQALEGRIPGLHSVGVNGAVGAGRFLRIRGADSYAGTRQRPLLLIDGVRVDTEARDWGQTANVTCCLSAGAADRLSDLNPEEIDRVEVLKGPAAAALFGAEGSGGVIQVFTKRGRNDTSPVFTFNSAVGFNRLRANLPTRLRPNITGPDGFAALDPNEHLIEEGIVNTYDLTVSGGGRDVTYFASAGLSYEEGSIKPNDQTRGNLRVNLNWTAADNLSVDVASGYVRNRIWSLAGRPQGVYPAAMLVDPFEATEGRPFGGPYGLGEGVSVDDAREAKTVSDTERWTGRVQIGYNPLPNFSHRLSLGADRVGDELSRELPWGRYYTLIGEQGEMNAGHRRSRKLNVEFVSAYDYDSLLGVGFLAGSLSLGAQAYWDDVSTRMLTGRGYSGADMTFSGATDFFPEERTQEAHSRGAFILNRLDLGEDLFLTTAVRVDAHSAFGDNVAPQVYPKAAVAYNLPRSVLPAPLSNLKVRGAVGVAGKPPPRGIKFPTGTDASGERVDLPPNHDVEPENEREFETGLELGLLNDRIGVELTYYDARVTNALFSVRQPDGADVRYRTENCCEIMNRGVEAAVSAWLVDAPSFSWNANLLYEWNRNQVTDLGPAAVVDSLPRYEPRGDGTWEHVGWWHSRQVGFVFEGESIGDIFCSQIAGYDPETNRHTRTRHWFNCGGISPTHMGSVFNRFQIGNHIQLAFQLRGEMGAVTLNRDRGIGVRSRAHDEFLTHLAEDGSPTQQSDSVLDYHRRVTVLDKRDHIRLQEVSLTYAVPEGIAGRLGMQRTTVTLSGHNLHWWDDCNCPDPGTSAGWMTLPQPRRFLLSVRTRF